MSEPLEFIEIIIWAKPNFSNTPPPDLRDTFRPTCTKVLLMSAFRWRPAKIEHLPRTTS
jgi:hypothetical protein